MWIPAPRPIPTEFDNPNMLVVKGNKREVPASMPPLEWWKMVQEYKGLAWVQAIPWYLPGMEYLTPDELATVRAKASVWLDMTGDWPTDIDCWWEIRQCRKRGDLPPSEKWATTEINETGATVCDNCGARWAPHKDGSPQLSRCKLCGVNWITEVTA